MAKHQGRSHGSVFWIVSILFFVVLPTVAEAQTLGDEWKQGLKPEAVADHGMVNTQNPLTTEAAVDVLRRGGNAVDAMITSVIMDHVVDTHQNSHFGSMSGIYFEAATGEYHVISAVSQRPDSQVCGSGDPSRVAIGGVIRGLEALWERWGSLPWSEYFEQAIRHADEGVQVTSFMYLRNGTRLEGGEFTANEVARRNYMPDGHLVPVGERWKMPLLAEHLRRLAAEGADYMYEGEWAQDFVDQANRRGYCVTMADMAGYSPVWQEPVRFTYRDHEFIGSPPPDRGGAEVGYNLKILEHFDLKELGHYSESPEAMEVIARTFGRVQQETSSVINDPLNFQVPFGIWLDEEYARFGAEFVRGSMRQPGVELAAGPGQWPPGERALHEEVGGGGEVDWPEEAEVSSNHNVIVDSDGNWFSALHTGHGGAPGIWMDGHRTTGSTAHAFTSGPGRRLVLPITTIMIARPGEDAPWLAMGTPGSPPQPVTQVLINMFDYEMHPSEAVDAPRFWAFRGTPRAPVIRSESRLSESVRRGLRMSGIGIQDIGEYHWGTGSMQIVWRDRETNRLHGVTDPRRLGRAAGH